MNQLESTDGLDFFAKIFFMERKMINQLKEINNIYKEADLLNGKKKTENHIEVSISHLSLIIT